MRRSTYSVTSCSGLMNTSTDRPSTPNSPVRLVYSAARMRGIAGHGAHVEAVLHVAQGILVDVHHGHLVRLFAREVVRGGASDLAGAEYQDLHALQSLQVGILHHQPLGALALEIHLHARVRARALDVEHHAVAELAVAHARTEPHP